MAVPVSPHETGQGEVRSSARDLRAGGSRENREGLTLERNYKIFGRREVFPPARREERIKDPKSAVNCEREKRVRRNSIKKTERYGVLQVIP